MERKIICNSQDDDPARFEVRLSMPMNLTGSWQTALHEIIIPNTIHYMTPADYIDISTLHVRKKRSGIPSPAAAEIHIENYFPWLRIAAERRSETIQQTYLYYSSSPDLPVGFPESILDEIKSMYSAPKTFLTRLLTRGRREAIDLWSKKNYTQSALQAIRFSKPSDFNEDILDAFARTHLPSFCVIQTLNDSSKKVNHIRLFKRIYRAVFENRIKKFARDNMLSTLSFMQVIDPIITSFHRYIINQQMTVLPACVTSEAQTAPVIDKVEDEVSSGDEASGSDPSTSIQKPASGRDPNEVIVRTISNSDWEVPDTSGDWPRGTLISVDSVIGPRDSFIETTDYRIVDDSTVDSPLDTPTVSIPSPTVSIPSPDSQNSPTEDIIETSDSSKSDEPKSEELPSSDSIESTADSPSRETPDTTHESHPPTPPDSQISGNEMEVDEWQPAPPSPESQHPSPPPESRPPPPSPDSQSSANDGESSHGSPETIDIAAPESEEESRSITSDSSLPPTSPERGSDNNSPDKNPPNVLPSAGETGGGSEKMNASPTECDTLNTGVAGVPSSWDTFKHRLSSDVQENPREWLKCFHLVRSIDELKTLLGQLNTFNRTQFVFDDAQQKVRVNVDEKESVTLHGRLPEVLSLPKHMRAGEKYRSKHCVDIRIDNRTGFLYSRMIKGLYVGDINLPVLQVIHLESKPKDLSIHVTFPAPMYLDLNTSHITEISLVLYNEVGEKVIFDKNSCSQVRLSFIKRESESSHALV